ncbi:MAG: SMC-Scp complex subunit ScpB [Pyramidobacter sp.]|uniref:SMC-Scp complex subunit ScpB n=1 Tax=Pyramidobacter sp. TaxID=1943581 RepID=UPI002A80CF62|nr:SMC-Scp complex subunit ScpB [Pyramidobacter sp.]MDY4032132.1 SMC-Scp complex subunit ScpB [Pyramidobacter sp.]
MSLSRQEEPENLLIRQIEAILFVAADGASVPEISLATGRPAAAVRKTLAWLNESYALSHGLEIVELGGKWFMTTASDLSEIMDKFHAADESERVRLTRASLETLAVIAYSQPVTRSEIEAIRGVRCDRVIDTLLGYGLARIAGRRKSTGSPLLYRTTTKFLEIFGLGAISDLPTIDELEELKRHRPETENPSAELAAVPETGIEAGEDEAE